LQLDPVTLQRFLFFFPFISVYSSLGTVINLKF